MSPDVKELVREKLSGGRFPAESRADFRLYIAPEVRRSIEQHAKADTEIEICGVLVGRWETDENGPYARVTNLIRCESASSKFAEVTFTHESWAQINKEMDSKYADDRIIGWYHSHPDFGIFLSDRDCFIQQHFFSGPGQIAFVIDPVRDLEGVFSWRDGKPTLLPHFWVGDRIRTAEASERATDNPANATGAIPAAVESSGFSLANISMLGLALALLALLVAFWMGNFFGRSRTAWEQRMVIEGAVAHFADAKIIREGLEEDVAAVRARLLAVSEDIKKLPAPAAELSKEQNEEAAKLRKSIDENLTLCTSALATIGERYGLDAGERGMMAMIAAQRQAALRKEIERVEEAAKNPRPPAPIGPPSSQTAPTNPSNDKKATAPAGPSNSVSPPATTSPVPAEPAKK